MRSVYAPGSGTSSVSSVHRQSFSESLRGHPPSPRARRQPSLTQVALQELLDNPPVANPSDPAFVGRDWKSIAVGELIDDGDVRFVELDTGVEAATNVGNTDGYKCCQGYELILCCTASHREWRFRLVDPRVADSQIRHRHL